MGILAIRPVVEIRPPMFANLKKGSTRIGWDSGLLGGVGEGGGMDCRDCSCSDGGLLLGVSICGMVGGKKGVGIVGCVLRGRVVKLPLGGDTTSGFDFVF